MPQIQDDGGLLLWWPDGMKPLASFVSRVWLTPVLLLMLFALTHAQDGRCYLKEGSSSASFTVTELLPPGGIIGVLEVGGNASKQGDIILDLQESKLNPRSMIEILPETKSLVLIGKLDKEGREGPSQLLVQIKCEKKNSNDPAIIIPVRIVVQDANDNAPTFVNAPYVLQLSEAMTPGMVISSDMIKAFDGDQPGPFNTIQYSVEPGPYSNYLSFQSALAPTLVIKRQLDFETLPNFTVIIRAQDQGQPPLYNTTKLTIRVLDADDQNPRFLNQSYLAVLPRTNSPGDVLKIEPAPIRAVDQDRDINAPVYYSFDTETADSSYFNISPQTGEVSLHSAIPQDMAFPITLVIRATQLNNEDRRDLTTLIIGRNPVLNGLRFLSHLYHLSVPENLPNASILLRLQTNRPFDEHLQFSLRNDYDGQFQITKSGDILLTLPLDYEKAEKITLDVKVSSGSMSDASKVELTVIDVNEHDPKFNHPVYRFRATSTSIERRQSIGRIVANDGDRDDQVTLTIMGANANAFVVDKEGYVFVRNASLLNATVTHLVAIATDDGQPPRKSSVPLEIVVPDEVVSVARALSLDSTFFLMIVFGVSLGILFVVIIVLAVHIAKRKHQRERVGHAPIYSNHQPMGKMASYMASSFQHQKLGGGSGGDSGNSSSDTENGVGTALPPVATVDHLSHHLHPSHVHRNGAVLGRRSAGNGMENPVFQESPQPLSRRGLRVNGQTFATSPQPSKGRGGGDGSQASTSSTDDGCCSSSQSHGEDSDEPGSLPPGKGLNSGLPPPPGLGATTSSSSCWQVNHNLMVQHQKPSAACTCSDGGKSVEVVGGDIVNDDEDSVDDEGEIKSGMSGNRGFRQGTKANLQNGLKRSSMKLRVVPDKEIPKRVKKLSWEDEQVQKASFSGEQDREVSVVPFICKHTKTMDHPDLTVYF